MVGNTKILVGPNSIPSDPDLFRGLNLASRLFGSFAQVKNIYIIEFNNQDITWGQAEYQTFQDQTWRSDYLTKARSQCPSITCQNASAELNNQGDAIILIGINSAMNPSDAANQNPGQFNGTQIAHEYVHTIQILNSRMPQNLFRYALLPPWLQEGQAMWAAQVSVASSYVDYLALRKIDYPELATMSPSYSTEWISKFLNPNPILLENADNWAYWAQFPNYRIYDIGALAIEILTCLKGPTAVMKLYADVGLGDTFIQAFQKEFGISYSDAVPYISAAIAAELKLGVNS